MEEGIQKLVAGQVAADVFFPTTDYIRRLVADATCCSRSTMS